ncbi:hypothetical protein AMS68_003637 [Peltaster fructicola]|uniref:Nucleoporin protein Ndc1-Nup n=1 Tax=Peltaster fructicola TaxID=286661 RepID=A0A6H0XUJ1_9PEZI|nr:hypothetical protein AMS68_003637 [Peltaster fructicola]
MPKSKAYKELLTTSLHRRFTNASAFILAFCLVEAIITSNDSFLRAWNPFGYTGLRTLLLFLPCLFVFILRVYNLHFGARTTVSGIQKLYQLLITPHVIVTFAWYLGSALLFGEVYIWTKGREGHLDRIDQGRAYERARLNENPVILRTSYVLLAIIQTGAHFWYNLDQVQLKDGSATKPEDVTQQLARHVLPVIKWAFNLTFAGVIAFMAVYYLFMFRHLIWRPTHALARFFDHELSAHARPSGVIHLSGLVWQGCISAFLLGALWHVSNIVFTLSMAEPPTKRGQPLTSDVTSVNGAIVARAVDANGSLINGLTRKKESPHTFALWELYLICTQFIERRQSIFLEVDRAGGSSWAQISRVCLAEVEAIGGRIQRHQSAIAAAQNTPAQTPAAAPTGLPKIAAERPRDADITSKQRPDFAQSLATTARLAGQHPGAANPLSPAAKQAERALAWGTGRLLPQDRKPQLSLESVDKQASGKLLQALQTPLGWPFRETFAQTAKVVVLGTPYSSQTNITHAARSLAALLKASTEEDKYGIVAKDVPMIVNTLLGSIRSIRGFLQTTQPSWTDVEFEEGHRQVPEILEVVNELQQALEAILLAFGEYAISLGMSKKELREAKEAVGMNTGQAMVQVR